MARYPSPPSYYSISPQAPSQSSRDQPQRKPGFPREYISSFAVILAILCFIGGLALGTVVRNANCEATVCPAPHKCAPPIKCPPPIIRTDPRTNVPWPGRTYVIALANTNLVLSGADSQLKLVERVGDDVRTHWYYSETEHGWFTLRNIGTGRYLGRNRQGSVIARAMSANDFEYLETRANPHGSFGIYVKTDQSRAGMTQGLGLQGQVALWTFLDLDETSFLVSP